MFRHGFRPSVRLLPPSQHCPHRSTRGVGNAASSVTNTPTSRISLERIRGKQPRERPP